MSKKKLIIIISSVVAAILVITGVVLAIVLTHPKQIEDNLFTVTFNSNGGSAVESLKLEAGEDITRPTDPTKEMFTFDKWYSDKALTSPFDFDNEKMPEHDITLYANWIPEESVLVSFDANGGLFPDGTRYKSAVYNSGAKASATAEEPVYEGYQFAGWFTDVEGTNQFNFNNPVTDSVVLYARWDDDPSYAYVTYYGNGKYLMKSALPKGSVLGQSSADLSGYEVDGWYTEATLENKYSFGSAINSNITLYASYYSVGLVIVDGTVTNYYGNDSTVVVPNIYQGQPVTAIGDYAFYRSSQATAIQYVELPDSITTLGEGAFYSCFNLIGVNLSANVTKIGASVFHGDLRLKYFGTIENVAVIPEHAFLGCESLKAIQLSDVTTTIGEGAFIDCKSLTSMVIPRNVTVIANQLFDGCSKLVEVEFKAVMNISFGKQIFSDCDSLDKIIIQAMACAEFTEVNGTYQYSPFVGCNAKIYVQSNVLSNYNDRYGYLDDNIFSSRLNVID